MKGPQNSAVSTMQPTVDASIRETRSELMGTNEAAGRTEAMAQGEYRPMASATVSVARMELVVVAADSGSGEDAEMSDSTGEPMRVNASMVGAAMTSPLP